MGKAWTEIHGATNSANRFIRLQGFMTRELRRAIDETADDAIIIYQAHAPRRSGRLARGVARRSLVGGGEEIGARAIDPDSGFDYVAVSRFGHIKARIVPTRGRWLKLKMGMRRNQRVFRKSVRGFHPTSDWVDDARVAVETEAERNMARFNSRLQVRGI